MKKIISFVLCMCFLLSSITVVTSEENSGISGLQENLDKLWMKNNFTPEQMDNMIEQWKQAFTKEFMRIEWDRWQDMSSQYNPNIINATQDEELSTQINLQKPIPEQGLRVTNLNGSAKYMSEYAQHGEFEYKFSDTTYWIVANAPGKFPLIRGLFLDYPHEKQSYCTAFTADGNLMSADQENIINITVDAIQFLNNWSKISGLLNEYGVKDVVDTKLFTLSYNNVFLYLICDNNNYLVRLGSSYDIVPQIELFRVYPMLDVVQKFSEKVTVNDPEDRYNFEKHRAAELSRDVSAIKPTFAAEAEALQQSGLLNGNEKGLDLLKPLTRIEAATLIVRALGLENVSTAGTSKFADIPNDNWGMKYANIAADKGITNGIGDGNFAPNALVTDNQFATMLLRSVNTPEFDWQTGIQLLIEKGIITEEESKTMDLFTRGDMAKIIYEARAKDLL